MRIFIPSFDRLAITITSLILFNSMVSCKKLITIDPPIITINQENVYKSDATAIAAVINIYTVMVSQSTGVFNGQTGISFLTGLSSDELILDGSNMSDNKLEAYYKNELFSNATGSYGGEFWGGGSLYYFIFLSNSAIEGLEKSTTLTQKVKNQLLGEAKFIRAFCHFYLVNFFGDVPLILSTDPIVNSTITKTPKLQVFQQIIADLKEAQSLLSENFIYSDGISTTLERTRPSKWAANSLLARVYLYTNDNESAIQQANSVINNTALFSVLPLNDVFLKNSKEAIWQLQPIQSNRNTEDAFTFIIPATGPSSDNPVYINSQLLNSFEIGDQRRYGGNWIDSIEVSGITYYFPYKYKATITTSTPTEYLMIMRLSELYLIRAEAKAKKGDLQGAIDDVNFIRMNHGGLTNALSVPINQTLAIAAVLHERQVEFFTEVGHRWLDMKRLGVIDQQMQSITPLKGGIWQTTDQLYPIPFFDLQKNLNLVQNPGYQ